MAWAIVTAAGTPWLRCAATAPGATALMNACWAAVSFRGAGAGAGWCLRYGGVGAAGGPADRRCAATGKPGIAAVLPVSGCGAATGPEGAAAGDVRRPAWPRRACGRGLLPVATFSDPRLAVRRADCLSWPPPGAGTVMP